MISRPGSGQIYRMIFLGKWSREDNARSHFATIIFIDVKSNKSSVFVAEGLNVHIPMLCVYSPPLLHLAIPFLCLDLYLYPSFRQTSVFIYMSIYWFHNIIKTGKMEGNGERYEALRNWPIPSVIHLHLPLKLNSVASQTDAHCLNGYRPLCCVYSPLPCIWPNSSLPNVTPFLCRDSGV
jgi:hypothetical protein